MHQLELLELDKIATIEALKIKREYTRMRSKEIARLDNLAHLMQPSLIHTTAHRTATTKDHRRKEAQREVAKDTKYKEADKRHIGNHHSDMTVQRDRPCTGIEWKPLAGHKRTCIPTGPDKDLPTPKHDIEPALKPVYIYDANRRDRLAEMNAKIDGIQYLQEHRTTWYELAQNPERLQRILGRKGQLERDNKQMDWRASIQLPVYM